MNDIIFKIVFGKEQNASLLCAMLNALLSLNGDHRIVDLTILNPYVDKQFYTDKGVILDVKARDRHGRRYNVEVQLTDEPHFIKRTLYYLARLFCEQIQRGDDYSDLARTIAISLVDFRLFPEIENLHSTYRFCDTVHGRELSDVLEIHYIELIKFKMNKPHALRTPFEKWLHILKFGEIYERNVELLPANLREEDGIVMAMEKMWEARSSDEVREMILMLDKAFVRESAIVLHAREEAAREVARKLFANGVDADIIYKSTGLRAEDLK